MRAIALLALLAATAAWAQMPKVYRIGVLETTSEGANRANLAAFRKGLREAGYVEGQNYVIDYRSAEGRADRFPQLAAELVRAKPDVIVTRGFAAARAANGAGPVPVVMASAADAVAAGVVKNLAHPGGNVTGLTTPIAEFAGRRIEVLKELAPQTRRIGVMLNLSSAPTLAERRQIESTAKAAGMEVLVFDVRDVKALRRALDQASGQRVDALVVNSEGVLIANLSHRLVEDTDWEYSEFSVYDLGQAVAHMSFQAQSLGLHVRQFRAFNREGMTAEFEVPSHWEVTTMSAIGRIPVTGDRPGEGETVATDRRRHSASDIRWPQAAVVERR